MNPSPTISAIFGILFAITVPSAHAQSPSSAPALQAENTGIFRIVPGDPFVGGEGAHDGCIFEDGKAQDRFQIKMSFGNSYLQFSSDDEDLRTELRKPIGAESPEAPDATYTSSVDFFKDGKSIGAGACTLTKQTTTLMISNPVNPRAAKITSPGFLFDVMCQPKNRGTLQGQIFCRLRTRGR